MARYRVLFFGLIVTASVSAFLTEEEFPWQPPGPGDLRSPCPGINTLANHGLLPRDGRNIDLEVLGEATALGYNMEHNTIDVDQHVPQVIEHDGSITRDDKYFGDSNSFSHAAWGRALASWGDIEIIDFAAAAREIKARFEWGEANNPEFNGTFARTGSLLQYALLLSAFGDYGNANLTLVRYWVEHERLPLRLGWQPPVNNINSTMNRFIAANISALWI
ncbi:hypothetical protein SGCOL_009584 [Colletotrichum sp. CLE4]